MQWLQLRRELSLFFCGHVLKSVPEAETSEHKRSGRGEEQKLLRDSQRLKHCRMLRVGVIQQRTEALKDGLAGILLLVVGKSQPAYQGESW